jgi:response regulator RpfG family c-di-GMP phosphodiesterase
MEKPIADNDLQILREKGLLTLHEVAIMVGDVIIAENVLTKERRILETGTLLLESTKKVLKG